MVKEGAMNILLFTLSQTHLAFLVTHWRQRYNKPNVYTMKDSLASVYRFAH